MRKFLVLSLLGLSVWLYSASVYAADIKFEGDFRVRGIYTDNTADANDAADDTNAFGDARFRLRTTATAGVTTGVVVLDFLNGFSDPKNTSCAGACGTGNFRFGAVNFGNSRNVVGVRAAYLKLDLGGVKLAFGSKPFKLGHGLILDDTAAGAAVWFGGENANLVLADLRLADSQSGSTGSTAGTAGKTGTDTDLYIVKGNFKHGDHKVGLFASYLLDRDNQLLLPVAVSGGTAGTAGEGSLWVYGVTLDGQVGPFDISFEVDLLDGEVTTTTKQDLKGLNLLLGLGTSDPYADGNGAGVVLVYTTGDESSTDTKTNINGISGNYVLGNILGNDSINSDRDGRCASVRGSRIGTGSSWCVNGAGYKAVKAWTGLHGLPFGEKSCHTNAAVIWAQTTEPHASGADKDLGIEVDVDHKHKLDEHTAVVVNLGYLLSGDAYKMTGLGSGTDNQILAKIAINYTF